ncbi:hypothetical protein THAOC_24931 [Thalassiosira oceanica]|uniref:Uncharacterized protein n=1 Tax=Thalassiosira oceanica TaxID=159749 RepID=K0RQI9_THAOC|nr:hypothetical protein THAOC_24931 [Thalassiosira oceanica]|eukprot:EJK55345.1 hypothetical protein THAOC_24931 [Thalassiosira oceanica]
MRGLRASLDILDNLDTLLSPLPRTQDLHSFDAKIPARWPAGSQQPQREDGEDGKKKTPEDGAEGRQNGLSSVSGITGSPAPGPQAPSTGRNYKVSREAKPQYKMSAEYAGKRQRDSGEGRTGAVIDPEKTSATSAADLESMLKQALGRIASLERQHEEIQASVEGETRALREDICKLEEANKALQVSMERDTRALQDDIEALKSENDALKWSLKRLASKVQEGWEYPVTIQPDEYWQRKGYDDPAIVYLTNFFEELKFAVSQLEHGVCEIVTVCCAGNDEDLMPHWNALFRSFNYINRYDKGMVLRLHYIELNEEIMRQICNHIRHKNIRQVSFENNRFTNMRGAIIELENALKSPKLKCLTWYRNPIVSVEDMNLFTRALSRSDAVDELTFTRNGNGNAQALLSVVDFSRYKLLNFSSNYLRGHVSSSSPSPGECKKPHCCCC